MTRILFVVDAPYDFGALLQLNVLIRGLDPSRNEIHLAIMTELAPSGLFAENSERHLVPPNSTASQKFVWLRSLIKHLQPEIVHAWNNSSHTQVKNATSFTKNCRRVFTFLEQPLSLIHI